MNLPRVRTRRSILAVVGVFTAACGAKPEAAPPPDPEPAPVAVAPAPVAAPPETVKVRDPEAEARVARLEVALLEKEAQVEDLQARLEEARQEVVRAMAKVQTVATRAEAASAIAEAEIAVQALRSAGGGGGGEMAQATRLLQQSSAEFNRQNFGGAVYLADQAKRTAGAGRGRAGGRGGQVAGETVFAVPLRLKATSRSNVREGPGTGHAVVFTLEAGTLVTGYAHANDWIRMTDGSGRSGWVYRPLLGRP